MSKGRGRPPLDPSDPSVTLSLRLPSKRYDALYRTAAAERQTVSDLVRQALAAQEFRKLNSPGRDPRR